MNTGERIRIRRKEIKMSQADLAHKAGYASDTTISKIEKGARGVPYPQLERIASVLECTVESLLGFGDAIECDFSHRLPNGDVLYIVRQNTYEDGCMVLVDGIEWQLYNALSDGYMLIADRHTRHTDGNDIQGKIIAKLVRYE